MASVSFLRACLLGTLVAATALVFAVVAAGPALRSLTGPPPGFGSDYTSRAAYAQAVVAQSGSLAVSFLLLGVIARNRVSAGGWRWALWVANPLTVGVAYWLLRLARPLDWPYEYTAYHGWLLLALVAPLVFAPCVYFGARLPRMHL